MDWLTFVSKLVDSLAWPLVALILGLVFRKKVLELITTIRKLKAGPVEAEFEIETKQIRATATAALQQVEITQATPQSPGRLEEPRGEVFAKLLNARNDPTGQIIEGWSTVDGELFRLGKQLGFIVDPLESTTKVYQAVMASDVLPEQTRRLVRELRDLRNKVAHGKVQATTEAAQDYLVAVDRVVELIFNYRKNIPNYTPDVR